MNERTILLDDSWHLPTANRAPHHFFINQKKVASGMENKKVRRSDDRSEVLGDNWPAHPSADRWHYHPFPLRVSRDLTRKFFFVLFW